MRSHPFQCIARRILKEFFLKGRTPLTLLSVFVLGCSIGPDRGSFELEKGQELLLAKDENAIEEFRGREGVVEVIEGKKEGRHYLVVEKGRFNSRSKEGGTDGGTADLKEVDASKVKVNGKKLRSPELPESDPASGFELPDIFDIFTRVY